ncbi:hypothetical protein [Deinococcus radiotolerans]|uniref:Lipoprotein n=1 Tax=Deinococcus radiotolerans TaxID=1309407 RepID=A0ABQ2FJU3_9DEIO|nr:hypothetical protein [Deinococcus radiotolerans]GGK95769.1 hypothetical protein GCM10010844_12820 [Deinococcus radiotolerans]
MFRQTIVLALSAALLAACGAAPAPTAAQIGVLPPVSAPTQPDPTGPALHVLDDHLVRVTTQGEVLIIEATDPTGTTFMRLTGCPGGCRLTGEQGVLLPPAGLRVNVLDGLTVQARAPLGQWTDAATYH